MSYAIEQVIDKKNPTAFQTKKPGLAHCPERQNAAIKNAIVETWVSTGDAYFSSTVGAQIQVRVSQVNSAI